ncbi:uroporphyrinogen-III synthase [Chthonobacter albigriseus]|uniref:uroporphyrinogen-III synthase n=1 Tax=Chthonobacter albigriseus TaxID=1683161 RepID=UPI0015EFCC01|nr:uroporphyrinogen-III synthase [Chthonobacter albigriseus]
MRVLILRPEPQAEAMARTLAGHRITSIIAPMLRVDALPGAGATIAADRPGLLILTSLNAVSALQPVPESLRTCAVVAVGTATAEAARHAGFADVYDAGGDAEAVLELVRNRFQPSVGLVIHAAGRDRAGDVAERLAADGFAVKVVEVYRAEMADKLPAEAIAALGEGSVDAIVVGSERTARALRRSLEAAALTLGGDRPAVVAISAKAAAPLAPELTRIVVAEHPTGEDLTKAVVALGLTLENNAGVDDIETRSPDSGSDDWEEAANMASGNDRRDTDPFAKAGRRKGKPTTIDLTATEIAARAARADEAAAAAQETPVAPEPMAEAVGTPGSAAADLAAASDPAAEAAAVEPAGEASAEPEKKADDPDQIFVSDVLAGAEQPGATGSESTRDDASTEDTVHASSAAETAGAAFAEDPAPRVAAATYPPPREGRGTLGTVAAALLGGVVALGGGALLYTSGVLPPVGADPAEVSALRTEVAALSEQLAALDARPAPAPDAALAERVGSLETALGALPQPPADQGEAVAALKGAVDELGSRLTVIEQQAGGTEGSQIAEVTAALESLRADLDGLRTAQTDFGRGLEEQRAAVTDLANRPQPPTVDPQRVETLEQSVAGVIERIGALDQSLGETRGSVTATVEGLRSTIDGVAGSIKPVADQLTALDGRLADIEARLAEAPKQGEIAALSLAVTSLSSKVAAGEPFKGDLDVLRATASELPDLAALDATAAAGVATTDELVAGFPTAEILAARPAGEDTGLLDRMMIGAKSLVNYRETGDSATDPLSVPLDDLRKALDAGDLPAAAEAWTRLPAFAQERSAAWKASLDERVAADKAVADLTQSVLTRLQAGAGEPAAPAAN